MKTVIIAFILFAGLVATMVTICVRQDISLVTKDYYQQELVYQQQIDRMTLTEGLATKPVIARVDAHTLSVAYDDFARVRQGELVLFRPSDATLDRKFVLSSGTSTVRHFGVKDIPAGMYRARMTWTMDGQQYYFEQMINL